MKRLFLAAFFALSMVVASAQHADNHQHNYEWNLPEEVGETPAVLEIHTGFAPRIGLTIQKSVFLEAGASLDVYKIGYTPASDYKSFSYSNLRPYVAGEILLDTQKFLGGGKLGAEYIMASPIFGMAVGADVSYMTDGQRDAVLITPRLMLSFVQVEVFYGYSFFARNELVKWIGHHRFGVSTTLNTRFWHQKRRMYNAYYESYLK